MGRGSRKGVRKWRSEQFRGRIIALWLSPVAEEERGKEREREGGGEERGRIGRQAAFSSPSCTRFDAGGCLMSHLRRNLRIWLDTGRECAHDLPYTMVGVFICEEIRPQEGGVPKLKAFK